MAVRRRRVLWLLLFLGIAGLCPAEPAFPLRVTASGRYLEDHLGQAFFVSGEAAWSLCHNLTYEQAERYLEDRRARGLNALIISVLDAYAPDGTASYPPDRQGNFPFTDDDISRPVEAYWRHIDRVLLNAEEKGFLVLVWPFYLGCCDDGYMRLLLANGPARARQYGHFIGSRYGRRKNLIWVHGGDHDPGVSRGVIPALKDWLRAGGRNPARTRELVAAVKAGITDAAPGQLHATHWAPETDPYSPYGENFTDVYATYTYGPVAAAVSRHYAHSPVKPVLLLETHYENDFAGKTADDVMRYPYRAVLSGAAGYFFGNRPLWYHGYGWEDALDSAGSRAMASLGRLFRSRPWERLVPEPAGDLVIPGGGDPTSDTGIQSARATDGSFAMVFVSTFRTVHVDLSRIGAPAVRAWWFDIRSGSASAAGDFPGIGKRSFTPPGGTGFVLVLDDSHRGFAPPGSPGRPGTPRKVPPN